MSVPDSSSGGSGTLPRGKPNETGIGSSVPLGAKPLIFRPSVAPTGGTTSLFHPCNRLKSPTNFSWWDTLRRRWDNFTRISCSSSPTPSGHSLRIETTKHPKVRSWLERHPRFHFHFTPTSGSWLNAVEGFFTKLTKQRLKRGVFKSIVDLQTASADTSPRPTLTRSTSSGPPSPTLSSRRYGER